MSRRRTFADKRSVLAVSVLVVFAAIPLLSSLISYVTARSAQPFLEMPDPKYENCVRETEYMRYHHWELLAEVREDFVRHGKRGDITLSGCKECHPNRERFCNQCHNAVNLTPDCFGCHYYPETPEAELMETYLNGKTTAPAAIAAAERNR
ncbi:MAG: hypothetical protein JSW50_15115 [Candidatus Latescibacterota bacterium]|nr:MAG: hypothetical protein JSW50_15115 [Candidatus Latescibacterota bacterium]